VKVAEGRRHEEVDALLEQLRLLVMSDPGHLLVDLDNLSEAVETSERLQNAGVGVLVVLEFHLLQMRLAKEEVLPYLLRLLKEPVAFILLIRDVRGVEPEDLVQHYFLVVQLTELIKLISHHLIHEADLLSQGDQLLVVGVIADQLDSEFFVLIGRPHKKLLKLLELVIEADDLVQMKLVLLVKALIQALQFVHKNVPKLKNAEHDSNIAFAFFRLDQQADGFEEHVLAVFEAESRYQVQLGIIRKLLDYLAHY